VKEARPVLNNLDPSSYIETLPIDMASHQLSTMTILVST
jgi:hypothetical protein